MEHLIWMATAAPETIGETPWFRAALSQIPPEGPRQDLLSWINSATSRSNYDLLLNMLEHPRGDDTAADR
jgi:hypothetical protein